MLPHIVLHVRLVAVHSLVVMFDLPHILTDPFTYTDSLSIVLTAFLLPPPHRRMQIGRGMLL